MDVSDGLAGDLAKLAAPRRRAPVVDLASRRFPRRRERRSPSSPRSSNTAITGGDDYEILCCARRRKRRLSAARAAGVGSRNSRRPARTADSFSTERKSRLFQTIVLPAISDETYVDRAALPCGHVSGRKLGKSAVVAARFARPGPQLLLSWATSSRRRDQFGSSRAAEERKGEAQNGIVSHHRLRTDCPSSTASRPRRNCSQPMPGRRGCRKSPAPSPRARRPISSANIRRSPCRRRHLRSARHPARLGGRLRLPDRRGALRRGRLHRHERLGARQCPHRAGGDEIARRRPRHRLQGGRGHRTAGRRPRAARRRGLLRDPHRGSPAMRLPIARSSTRWWRSASAAR